MHKTLLLLKPLNKFSRSINREDNLLNKKANAHIRRWIRYGEDNYFTIEDVTTKRKNL